MRSPLRQPASDAGRYHTTGPLPPILAAGASFLGSISTSPFPVGFSKFPQSPYKKTPQHPQAGRFREIPRQPSPAHSTRPRLEFPEAQPARPPAPPDHPDPPSSPLPPPSPPSPAPDPHHKP